MALAERAAAAAEEWQRRFVKEREKVDARDAVIAAARLVLDDFYDSGEPRSIQDAMMALRRILESRG